MTVNGCASVRMQVLAPIRLSCAGSARHEARGTADPGCCVRSDGPDRQLEQECDGARRVEQSSGGWRHAHNCNGCALCPCLPAPCCIACSHQPPPLHFEQDVGFTDMDYRVFNFYFDVALPRAVSVRLSVPG